MKGGISDVTTPLRSLIYNDRYIVFFDDDDSIVMLKLASWTRYLFFRYSDFEELAYLCHNKFACRSACSVLRANRLKPTIGSWSMIPSDGVLVAVAKELKDDSKI